MKLGGSLVRGTPGRAGAASDNVRDGLGLSDDPGPASSEGKAYERNRCPTPRKSSAGSNLTDMGRCAARGWSVPADRPTPKPVASVRWGGHGECLRRRRGDAVGVKAGASSFESILGERGNHPRSPSRRAASPVVGRSVADSGPWVGRRPRSSPSARKARTWRRGPASQQPKNWKIRRCRR